MIVIGYQGIGKSTLVKERNSYIDFESSNFKINGERPDGWEQMYCEAALDLSRQGHVVFTASHKCIRDYLKEHRGSEVVLIVAPSVDLKDQWLEKLRNRYKETGLGDKMPEAPVKKGYIFKGWATKAISAQDYTAQEDGNDKVTTLENINQWKGDTVPWQNQKPQRQPEQETKSKPKSEATSKL